MSYPSAAAATLVDVASDDALCAAWRGADGSLKQEVVEAIGALILDHAQQLDNDLRIEQVEELRDYFRALLEADDAVLQHGAQLWPTLARQGVGLQWLGQLFGRVDELFEAFLRLSDTPAAQSRYRGVMFRQLGELGDQLRAQTRHDLGVAFHDRFTQLPTKYIVEQRLGDYVAQLAHDKTLLAVLVVQIEHLPGMVERLGAGSMDELFLGCVNRIREALREQDFIGQLARNQLALLLPKLRTEAHALLAANKVARVLDTHAMANGLEIPARLSIGVTLAPRDGADAELLLHKAELARRQARERGEEYLRYDAEFGTEELKQRALEEEFVRALHDNELMLYYQPQVDLRTARAYGGEALLRWKTPKGEFVPPNLIVAVAERTGHIGRLSNWVTNTAIRHCGEMAKAGLTVRVSINLTAANLADRELPDFVAQCLRTWNVPASQLTIELTEGSMINDTDLTLEVLSRLKRIGVNLSVDDFGTGYSSLAYLRKLPIDELKIDQIFVRSMLTVQRDEQIVRTVIDLSHNFGLAVLAEGCEDAPTLAALTKLGCDKVQGYHFAKPMPLADFQRWMSEFKGVG